MTAQHPAPTPLPQRSPLTLRLAGWAWAVAGVVFAITPIIAALMLRGQYRSIRRDGTRLATLIERLDQTDSVRVQPYIEMLEQVEQRIVDASWWAFTLALLLYLVFAVLALATYLSLSWATVRGMNGARITATVLAVLGTLIVFQTWQFFAAISWMPVTALSASHAGLAIIALHTAGTVLVWLPTSNAYVRERRLARRQIHALRPQ